MVMKKMGMMTEAQRLSTETTLGLTNPPFSSILTSSALRVRSARTSRSFRSHRDAILTSLSLSSLLLFFLIFAPSEILVGHIYTGDQVDGHRNLCVSLILSRSTFLPFTPLWLASSEDVLAVWPLLPFPEKRKIAPPHLKKKGRTGRGRKKRESASPSSKGLGRAPPAG